MIGKIARTLRYTGWRRAGSNKRSCLTKHNGGWSLGRPASADFEDYVFRPKEQSFGEFLGEVVNLSEGPIENGKIWMF